jgi:hypothetical protein
MDILISFLYLLLHIVVIVLIAAVILWGLKWLGIGVDPLVYKCGQAIVVLLILIAVVIWLSGLLGWTSYRLPMRFGVAPDTTQVAQAPG